MTEAPELDLGNSLVTDGEIAVNNLESARQQSWSRFRRDPLRPGIAEYIVEQELNFSAIWMRSTVSAPLVNELDRVDPESSRTALINAQIAAASRIRPRRFLR